MLTQFQQSILKMISEDEGIEATANRICREAESFAPGVFCSMVTVDRAGQLHPLAAPNLPDEYSAALDGIVIGPEVGSCGSAAFLNRAVAVTDISADHRWAPYKSLAEPLGLKACWSSPIAGSRDRVLGAFGFYYLDHRGPRPDEERLVAECTDLSSILLDRQEARAENFRLRYLDALTGLGNRAGLERAIRQAARAGRMLGLILLDIDHLRDINDEHGHAGGDALLRRLAQRIQAAAGPARAFRTHGGEFALLLEDSASATALPQMAERLLSLQQGMHACEGHRIAFRLSCGAATLHPLEFGDPAMLGWRAGLALRDAKTHERGRFVLFTQKLAADSARRFQAMHIARRALAEDRLEAHYQPLVEVGTGRIVGVEALARVRTPQGEILPAGRLGPAMQAASTTTDITDRMLALVARDTRRWLDHGIELPHVGVNLSRADFDRDDLCERILGALAREEVPPGQIVLELTETIYLDDGDRRVVAAVERLREEGLRVALDDFGTGFASLTHLLKVPVDIIKADKSLVDRLSPGSDGDVILKALAEMARGLGLKLVVEGVETAAQAARLAALGCGIGQGFLFGKPMPAAALERMLLEPAPGQND